MKKTAVVRYVRGGEDGIFAFTEDDKDYATFCLNMGGETKSVFSMMEYIAHYLRATDEIIFVSID